MTELSRIIKAYDIRGLVPEEISAELATSVGAAFVEVLGIRSADGGPGALVIGHDMRPSSPELVAAFGAGAAAHGVDVITIGLASTSPLDPLDCQERCSRPATTRPSTTGSNSAALARLQSVRSLAWPR
jgi:phosphomannomutase